MKLKWKALIMACVMSCSVAALVGCNNDNDKGNGDDGTQVEQPVNEHGELTIDDVKVYITQDRLCTFAEINPVFSKPDKAETLTYTYDTAYIKLENNVVTPIKREDKVVNVRAKSENFNVVFKVEVEALDFKSSSLYDVANYPVAHRAETCKAVNANTTLFIGDSFMDSGFIGDYMSTYAAGKEVLNAGISSTTSYHWENCFKTVIGATAPKNIVLHIGTNNFYDAHDTVEDTEESLMRLFMLMHNAYPTSNIYWFNITQRSNKAYASQVSETNAFIAKWCEKYDWITCVDTCSKVTEGMLKDGVHPQTEHYKTFTDALTAAGCHIVNKEN